MFVAILLGSAVTPASAGGPDYSYRASAGEVRLRFSALDQNNRGVAALQASDFVVVDKELIVRSYQSFTRTEWTQVEIAFLVDNSGSAGSRFHEEIADLMRLMSQTAAIPEENVSLFSFRGSQTALICAGNCQAAGAAERIPQPSAGALTPLFDGITTIAGYLSQRADERALKVLVVFSDGADTISRNSLAGAIDASVNHDVQVSCIDLNPADASANVLRAMSDGTGGRYFSRSEDSARALDSILETVRGSYTVTYRLPGHTAGFHEVRLLPTHNRSLQFRSRTGYYFPNQVR